MEEGVVTMIRIENLTKSYPSKMGPQYIFKNLNFDFPTENNVAILGKNGAGKSTLFRMLAKSEYPDKGRVLTNKYSTRFVARVFFKYEQTNKPAWAPHAL